jgi:hypothetical protein
VPAVLLPLLAGRRSRSGAVIPRGDRRRVAAGAAYFSLIGSGFMLIEISMMQRFTLLLGHPMYSLGIILFALILSTGAGSWLSERIRIDRSARLRALPAALAAYVLVLLAALPPMIRACIGEPLLLRAAVTCLILLPLGLLLGCFFPVGMRLLRASALPERVAPWYWGLNGIFGVLSSAAAVAISMYSGIPTNQAIAACFYLLLIPCIAMMSRGASGAPRVKSPAGDGESR